MVLGIILFVLYNSIDNFSVGIPYCIRSISAPGSPVPSTRIAFLSRAQAEAESEGNDDLEVVECDIYGNPIRTSVCSARSHRYDEYRQQLRDAYFITGNEIVGIVSGYYTVKNAIFLTDEEHLLVWNLLQNCTYEEGEQVASILRSDNKDNFLRDLNRDVEYKYDTPEESSIRYQGIINYYTGNTFSINHLRDYGLNYVFVYQDGNFSIYRLIIVNPSIYNLNKENIRNLYVRSGNSRQTFAFPSPDSFATIYILTEGPENFIRGRLEYASNFLETLTIFPVGHGYGSIFFKMLYNSGENVIIDNFFTEGDDNAKAYRNLFRLSVTPISMDTNGFVEGYEFNFTIFRPKRDLMRLLYPRYMDLYTYINPDNIEHFNIFLMSLNEDILRRNLIDIFRPNILKQLYDDF